jgi:hypothetical protein
MIRGTFRFRTLIAVAAAGLTNLNAAPALAEDDAAFNPAGQGAAWFGAATFRLTDTLISPDHYAVAGGSALSLAVAQDWASTPRSRVVAQIMPGASLGFALDDGFDHLVVDLREKGRPTFLMAVDPLVDIGFQRRGQTGIALRSRAAGWGITASAEDGQVAGIGADSFRGRIDRRRRPATATRYGLSVDRELGSMLAAFGGSWLTENQTILGARIREGYRSVGADSLFLDAGLSWHPRHAWRVGVAWRHGMTRVESIGGVSGGLPLISNAWAFDVTRFGVLERAGALSLRVSQPLRVANGAGRTLPVEYGYELRGASTVATGANLAPTGREIAVEVNWQGPALGGWATTGLYLRRNPGHFTSLPNDHGAAFSWTGRF